MALWAHVRNTYLRLGWTGRGKLLEWHSTHLRDALSEEIGEAQLGEADIASFEGQVPEPLVNYGRGLAPVSVTLRDVRNAQRSDPYATTVKAELNRGDYKATRDFVLLEEVLYRQQLLPRLAANASSIGEHVLDLRDTDHK